MHKGLLITIDGLPGCGKTTQQQFLTERLRSVLHCDVVAMQDLPDAELVRWVGGSYPWNEEVVYAKELEEIAQNYLAARDLALRGAFVIFERHICAESVIAWIRKNNEDVDNAPYLRAFDEHFGRPNVAIVLRMRVPALRKRLAQRARLEQLRLTKQELLLAGHDLRDYVQIESLLGVSVEFAGQHRPQQIAGRIWKHLHERFPDLLPDQSA